MPEFKDLLENVFLNKLVRIQMAEYWQREHLRRLITNMNQNLPQKFDSRKLEPIIKRRTGREDY
jgi:hypothetical protein